MPSTLGKYQLLRTLGTGAQSKVKLGFDPDTKKHYAIKILKKNNSNLDAKILELVLNEVQTMANLTHPNILNMIDYQKDGEILKSDGRTEPVVYIVLELAPGGELFDYVASTGSFQEPIARFYFKQLLKGIEYVHKHGITHRDMKPENLLFDAYFNLKIADFGFAAPLTGRDGSGYQYTKLGTESYMAPEIHQRKPYNGASVDLFAAGIILFIIVAQNPPFTVAKQDDPFYRLICANRHDLFWKAHMKNKPDGFFSQEFKSLINGLLQLEPSHRPSMAEVMEHPWYKGETATEESAKEEMLMRKEQIEEQAELDRAEKQAQKAAEAQHFVMQQRQRPQGYDRSEAEEEKEGAKFQVLENKDRECYKFVKEAMINTCLYTSTQPQAIILKTLEHAKKQGIEALVSDKKYKITLKMLGESGSLELCMRILDCENEKFCVEFTKIQGCPFRFRQEIETIKDFFQNFA